MLSKMGTTQFDIKIPSSTSLVWYRFTVSYRSLPVEISDPQRPRTDVFESSVASSVRRWVVANYERILRDYAWQITAPFVLGRY